MLLRITLFLLILLSSVSIFADTPSLEFIESRKNLFKRKSLDLVTPVEAHKLIESKAKLKNFLKQYGTLKLSVFSDKEIEECDCEETGPEPQVFVSEKSSVIFKTFDPPAIKLFENIELPKSIGPEFVLLDNKHGEYIKFGIWSENLRKWNVFRLNLHTYKADSISTEVSVDEKKAKAEIRYQFNLGESDMIEFNIYNQLDHDILSPTRMKSGGQIKYRIKVGRKYYFDLFIFGSHEQGM